MIATDHIAQEMKRRDLKLWAFGGGTICPLFDAMHRHNVEVIICRSEYGAGYAAIGAAKATGKPQVVAVTSGPGATNLVTPIADAYYDSVPIIALTGQVNTEHLGLRNVVRQRAFQQTNIIDIVNSITKTNRESISPDDLVMNFLSAFDIAITGRHGPVLIDMPMNSQKGECTYVLSNLLLPSVYSQPSSDQIDELIVLISQSRKPVFLIGAGCRGAYRQIRNLVQRLGIPCVASLPAVGIMPTDDPHYFGMVGHTGHPSANWIVQHSDLVVAWGARLDVRQTGTEVEAWAKDKKVVRVDIDQTELDNSRVRCDLAINARCEDVLGLIDKKLIGSDWYENWTVECGEKYYSMSVPDSQFARVIGEIDEKYVGDTIFVTGVGSHQQHAARHLTLDYPTRQFVTSAGHGCMGAGLPMAIGTALATGRRVVLIDGDGSFQMSLNELGTWMTYYPRIDLHVHIINNRSGGIVSQFARLNGYDPRETTWINPDFERIAEAYGLNVAVHNVNEEGVWPILESGAELDAMTWPEGNRL